MWLRKLLIAAIGVALAGTPAWANTTFGAKLDIHSQPSNSSNHFCNLGGGSHPDCTWVLNQAYHCEFGPCNHGELAPKDGTIVRLHLIACSQGNFVLQIARRNPSNLNQFRVVRSGPSINYAGDPQHCNGDTYTINTIPVNVPVHKGDFLAAQSQKPGFVYCSGGGNNIGLFSLPLPDNGAFRTEGGHDGCLMLLQAEYSN